MCGITDYSAQDLVRGRQMNLVYFGHFDSPYLDVVRTKWSVLLLVPSPQFQVLQFGLR